MSEIPAMISTMTATITSNHSPTGNIMITHTDFIIIDVEDQAVEVTYSPYRRIILINLPDGGAIRLRNVAEASMSTMLDQARSPQADKRAAKPLKKKK